eukprot:1153599-Pelagomonas_calceolata.AAC.1
MVRPIRLGEMYPIPAAIYGSQMWGTIFVMQGTEFKSELQVRHLRFLKHTLGVKRTTSNLAVLRECGHELLQFCWFRSVVKLYNSMLGCNSTTLKKVFQADCNMHSRASRCWTAQMLDRFQGLWNCDEYVQAVRSSAPIKTQGFTDGLRLRLRDVWNTAATNAASSYFGVPFESNLHAPVGTPRHTSLNLSGHVLRNLSRFRLRAHTLPVDRAIWSHGEESAVCDRCNLHEGQDEARVSSSVCALRCAKLGGIPSCFNR